MLGARLIRTCRGGRIAAATLAAGIAAAVAFTTPAAASSSVRHGVTPATSHVSATCKGVHLTAFAFHPAVVVSGKTSTLESVVANCTGKVFHGGLETFGKLVCEVVDPVVASITLEPHSSVAMASDYQMPTCLGRGSITGRLLSSTGAILQTRVAMVRIVAPPA